jgi:hypothetical protein
MMEGLSSSETSVLTRATRCNIPEDGIHQNALLVIWLAYSEDRSNKFLRNILICVSNDTESHCALPSRTEGSPH